jgi:hypothetical protein
MWGRLRIILLVASALLWAFFAYVVIDSSIIHPHKEPILDYVVVYGIFIYLGVIPVDFPNAMAPANGVSKLTIS